MYEVDSTPRPQPRLSREVKERVVVTSILSGTCVQHSYALITDTPWVPLKSFSKHGATSAGRGKKVFQDVLMTTDPAEMYIS